MTVAGVADAMRLVEAETVLATGRLLLEPLLRRNAAALYGPPQDPRIYRFVPQEPPETLEASEQRYRGLETRPYPRDDDLARHAKQYPQAKLKG